MTLPPELLTLVKSVPREMIPEVLSAVAALLGMRILTWIVQVGGIIVLTDKKDAATRLAMFSILFSRSGGKPKRVGSPLRAARKSSSPPHNFVSNQSEGSREG